MTTAAAFRIFKRGAHTRAPSDNRLTGELPVFIARIPGRIAALLLAYSAVVTTEAQAQIQLNQYGNPMKHAPRRTTAAITAEELRTRLYIFADDSMQGRQVGTVGNMKGTAYIASELKRLGVDPGGDDGSYFQRLPYVVRRFSDTPTLRVDGTALVLNEDFIPVPGTRAPRAVTNVPVIFGGVEGDTTRQITPAEAAGKFVVMSMPATGLVRSGPAGGTAAGVPAGCPVPAAGRGGNFNFGGGRGGASTTPGRFPDAVAVATVDLDALTPTQRIRINDPVTATNLGGRGAAYDYGANPAGVAVPNPLFRGVAGDIVVTTGNQVAIVRSGAVVSGSLPVGWTARRAVRKWQADSIRVADSVAIVRERTDTIVSAARRIIASGRYSGAAAFRGASIPLDSVQVVSLGCPRNVGRGGGRGGAGRGGAGQVATTGSVAEFRISRDAVTRIFGNRTDGLVPGATAGNATASEDFVEVPSDWGRNVIGVVRGSDPKLRGQYVAIGAHNDHNGFRFPAVDHDSLKAYNNAVLRLEMQVVKGDLRAITPAQRAAIHVNMDSIRTIHPIARMDSIQNGADDDGSGSMGVLEIAEAIARMPVKPKRSILFVWHTGEEAGLLGSAYFTANPTVPIDSIVAQINIDMIGRGRAEDMVGGGPTYLGAVGSKRLSSDLNREMLAANAAEPAGRKLRIDYRFDDPTLGTSVDGRPVSWPGYNNIYCRSDHANYANKCIPIVFFFTGLHGDYHQNTDEP
ncbi:MAG: M28 family peptidase, partial [Gemmatimonadales bacterium]